MYFQHSETEFKQHCSELFKMLKNLMEEESLTPRTLGPGSTSLVYYHSLGEMFLRSLDCRNIMIEQCVQWREIYPLMFTWKKIISFSELSWESAATIHFSNFKWINWPQKCLYSKYIIQIEKQNMVKSERSGLTSCLHTIFMSGLHPSKQNINKATFTSQNLSYKHLNHSLLPF